MTIKNVFFACLMIGIISFLPSCKNECKNIEEYIPVALQQFSFKPGSYWVYQDSISGIIDSQYVYYYTAHNNVVVQWAWSANGIEDCPLSTDTFCMAVASFWSGIPHDTILFDNGYNINRVVITESNDTHIIYQYAIDGSYTEILNNFSVSGRTFPTAYLSLVQTSPQVYIVDNVGIVKWVFNDSINGQHIWNLLRYHVINP